MIIDGGTRKALETILGQDYASETIYMAHKVGALETQAVVSMRVALAKELTRLLTQARATGALMPYNTDFTPTIMRNTYNALELGIRSTIRPRAVRLAAPPKGVVPTTLAGLRKWWDHYRRMGEVPERQREHARIIKEAFLKQVQEAWRESASDFLFGDTNQQAEAVEFITKRAGVAASRAKMITETETTHYYNAARRDIYDQSPDVGGYLFMAIRDHRTTKWCSTRHGLVYLKGDLALLDRETPPIHWYCRSELLPLVWQVPRQAALLADRGRARTNHHCEPLPPEWTGRQAAR